MNPISADVARQFCELCNWTYECWATHRALFDKNAKKKINIDRAKHFTGRLSVISRDYTILQICKLHDPAIQNGSINIGIDFIVRYGNWGPDADRISRLKNQLTAFFAKLQPARNKLLAHNDLESIASASALGEFEEGMDDNYFLSLQELVNAVHEKWLGGPYRLNDLAEADATEFLDILERANQTD